MGYDILLNTISRQAQILAENPHIYRTNVDPAKLWDLYLNLIPPEENGIFRSRRVYDCQSCKRAICMLGPLVAIKEDCSYVTCFEGKPDPPCEHPYENVLQTLDEFIRKCDILEPFKSLFPDSGRSFSNVLINEQVVRWLHVYLKFPKEQLIKAEDFGPWVDRLRENQAVLSKSFSEIKLESAKTMIETIRIGGIYRGDEALPNIEDWVALRETWESFEDERAKRIFTWRVCHERAPVTRILNTMIGTFISEVNSGMDFEIALARYENMAAPANYRRSKAVINPEQVARCRRAIEKLGLEKSLIRRHARYSEISINNVLFIDRTSRKDMSVAADIFSSVMMAASNRPSVGDTRSGGKIPQITSERFIERILPGAKTVEIQFKHPQHLASLIAPTDTENAPLFSWKNQFSWSYNGSMADAVDELVVKAGGLIKAPLRVTLAWYNEDDLDLSVTLPNKEDIYYANRVDKMTGGTLDVDANAGGDIREHPVENIYWAEKDKLINGRYEIFVKNFSKRSDKNLGFELHVIYTGNNSEELRKIYRSSTSPEETERKAIVTMIYHDGDLKLEPLIEESEGECVRDVLWNLKFGNFYPVKMIMYTPNYWGTDKIGNKHVLFAIEECSNPNPVRPFFIEQLKHELNEYRKVLEILGEKAMIQPTPEQVSGLLFSSTSRSSVFVKVRDRQGKSNMFEVAFAKDTAADEERQKLIESLRVRAADLLNSKALFRTAVDPDKVWSLYLGLHSSLTRMPCEEAETLDRDCCYKFVTILGPLVQLSKKCEYSTLFEHLTGLPDSKVLQKNLDKINQYIKGCAIVGPFKWHEEYIGKDAKASREGNPNRHCSVWTRSNSLMPDENELENWMKIKNEQHKLLELLYESISTEAVRQIHATLTAAEGLPKSVRECISLLEAYSRHRQKWLQLSELSRKTAIWELTTNPPSYRILGRVDFTEALLKISKGEDLSAVVAEWPDKDKPIDANQVKRTDQHDISSPLTNTAASEL